MNATPTPTEGGSQATQPERRSVEVTGSWFNSWTLISGIIGLGTIVMWCYLWWFDHFLFGSPMNTLWLVVVAGAGLVLGIVGLRRSSTTDAGRGRGWAAALVASNAISIVLGLALAAGPLEDPFFVGYQSPAEIDAEWAAPVYEWGATKVSASGTSGYCVVSVPGYQSSWKLSGESAREQIVLQGIADQAIGANGYEWWFQHRDKIDLADPYWEDFPMSEIPDDALTPDVTAVVADAMADACERYSRGG